MPTFSIDGQIVKESDATISVLDHGLLYGDGVFEGLRFYQRQIFKLEAHLARLKDSAKAIGLKLPMTESAMTTAMLEAIASSDQENGYIRLVVTRGVGPLGIDPTTCKAPKTIIIIDQLALVPPEIVQHGIDVIVAKTRRLSANQLDPRVKSLNYLNNILARNEATAAGAQEAIMLNAEGRIAEGSADNVFIVQLGKLITPPPSEGALAGITRQTVLDIAANCNIQVLERPIELEELQAADECFLTGTGAELIPVRNIDGRGLPHAKPIFARLQQAFTDLVTTPLAWQKTDINSKSAC